MSSSKVAVLLQERVDSAAGTEGITFGGEFTRNPKKTQRARSLWWLVNPVRLFEYIQWRMCVRRALVGCGGHEAVLMSFNGRGRDGRDQLVLRRGPGCGWTR